MIFANRISSSTSCSIWPPETSPPSSSRDVLRHRFQSCNTSGRCLGFPGADYAYRRRSNNSFAMVGSVASAPDRSSAAGALRYVFVSDRRCSCRVVYERPLPVARGAADLGNFVLFVLGAKCHLLPDTAVGSDKRRHSGLFLLRHLQAIYLPR